jgi:hypothetical protein
MRRQCRTQLCTEFCTEFVAWWWTECVSVLRQCCAECWTSAGSAGPSSSPRTPLARLPVLPQLLSEFSLAADLVLGLVAHPLLDRVPDLSTGPSAGPSSNPSAAPVLLPAPARVLLRCWTVLLVPDLALA